MGCNSTYSSDLLCYTNGSHEGLLSFVWLKFSSFAWDHDDEGIRSKKSLSLGMPMAPQVIIQREARN